MKRECCNCDFWVRNDERNNVGNCRVISPVRSPVMNVCNIEVQSDYWCGEFVAKKSFMESLMAGISKRKKCRIKDGASVFQDMRFFKFEDEDVIFEIDSETRKGGLKLVAPGYGYEGNYGNGAVYVDYEDIIEVE